MAIIHADNFSMYGTSVSYMFNGLYTKDGDGATDLTSDPSGAPGTVLRTRSGVNNFGGSNVRFPLPSNKAVAGAACRLWLDQLPPSTGVGMYVYSFRTAENQAIADLWVNPSGYLTVIKRSGGPNSATEESFASAGPVITANGFYHIEMKVVPGNLDNGSIEVRVEGNPVIVAENITTNYNVVGMIELGRYYNDLSFWEGFFYYKDVVFWDGEGTWNNDFLGTVIVASLTPTADVSLNWTPVGDTTGYSILDNSPPVDASYIFAEDDPLPDPYVAELSNLPPDITSVRGIITYTRAQKNDGGDALLQTGIISFDEGGNPYTVLGTNRPATTAFTYWRDVFEEDPVTNSPWLPSQVDRCQLQIDRTA